MRSLRRKLVAVFATFGLLFWAGAVAPAVADDFEFEVGELSPEFAPGYQPSGKRDERGLWYYMEKYEEDLQDSPFLITDPTLHAYVRDITCKLAGDYCQDIRIYILKTPFFNATMAPNGILTIWSGLLLRTRNEAQLAAVIGHELGHYFRRHSIKNWRKAKKRTAWANFLGMGLAVTGNYNYIQLTQLILIAGIFSHSRDAEREADAYGLQLMLDAGYDPREAARVWQQMIEEREADDDEERGSLLFATHPTSEERMETLSRKANSALSDARDLDSYKEPFVTILEPYRKEFLEDQVTFPKYGATEYLLRELIESETWDADLYFYLGEMYRRRAETGDNARALVAYDRAFNEGTPPPEIFRSMGYIHLKQGDQSKAEEAFRQYLALVPDALDKDMIAFYIQGEDEL